MKTYSIGVVVAALLSAFSANAGSVLRLNAGNIQTREVESLNVVQNRGPQDLIIQFKNAITERDKESLRGIGAEIFGYLPDDALMVRASYGKIQQWRGPSVEAVIPFSAQYKLSPGLTPASVFNRDELQSLTVKTFKESEAGDIAHKIKNMPGAVVYSVAGKFVVASVRMSSIQSVADLQGVEHVQPYREMVPMHMQFSDDLAVISQQGSPGDYSDINGSETGTAVMRFDGAWNAGFTGRNQTVAMADTGLDLGEGKLSSDFTAAVLKGQIFGLFSKSWDDPMGHGTHVSGSVLGRGAASGGKLRGGAYDASFVPQGMWSPMMKNLTVPTNLKDLFGKAYAEGARIHTNSWGSPRDLGAYDSMAATVDDFTFDNPEMLILFAAGNSGVDANKDGRIDASSISSPGTAKNALTVGASENVTTTGGIQVPVSKLRTAKDSWSAEPIFSSYLSDNANGIAMFSSRGPTADGRLKPEIVAPGTNILSSRSHVAGASELWGAYNTDYVFSGGTSMATPLAAGGAAVARQILQDKFQLNNPSGAMVKAILMHTAVDLYPGQYGEGGASRGQELLKRRPNFDEGYGRVDMTNVAQLGAGTQVVDNKAGLAQGEAQQVTFTLNRPGVLLANLVYADAPGSPDAAVALVNDLDLSLSGPQSIAPQDRRNNNEVIETSLPAGTYTLTISGFKVPQGKNGRQPFALIYTAREN